METADRALMPAEDEAGSTAWPEQSSSSATIAEVVDFSAAGGGGRSSADGDLLASAEGDELGSAELLRLGSMRSDGSGGGYELDLSAANPTPGWPAAALRGGLTGSRPTSAAPSSPGGGGRPPLAHRPGSASLRGLSSGAGGPNGFSPLSPSTGGGGTLGPPTSPKSHHQLGPVQGPRPGKASKMTLCKVLGDATGKMFKTGMGGGGGGGLPHSGEFSKAAWCPPLMNGDDFGHASHSSRDNPLFSNSALADDGLALDSTGMGAYQASSKLFLQPSHRLNTHTAEVDIMSLNPTPMPRMSGPSMHDSDEL